MKRRDFITMLGGAAASSVAWPLAARAQQGERMRRIGVLMGLDPGDPWATTYLGALKGGLGALGWVEGQNLRIDVRAAGDLAGLHALAQELLALGPELIVTYTTPAITLIRQAAPDVPVIFVAVSDPIGPGFVQSLARPGGNATGFINFEATMGSKWLELLRDIAPMVKRVAMLFNPATANTGATGGIYLPAMQAGARALGLELIVAPLNDPADIDAAYAALAQSPGGGASVMPSVFTAHHRERIVAQAARHRIPTVYPLAHFVEIGGLLSYGIDYADQFKRAGAYADRILKGARPADLPVEQPVKFELTINRNTAAALELSVPLALQVAADRVIE
jgi:putative tryptophan/tyrosine transport system substrate-binding protein